LYSGIGKNQEKCALLKTRELRAARFVRKFLYKNSYAPKAACICELLLGVFEKCARRSAHYLGLYFYCDSELQFIGLSVGHWLPAFCHSAQQSRRQRTLPRTSRPKLHLERLLWEQIARFLQNQPETRKLASSLSP